VTDYPNLRGNFRHILTTASLRDIHALLAELADHLQGRNTPAALHVALASDLVADHLAGATRYGRSARHLSPLPPHEGAGGERPKS
jgi:hypothetical protein